MRRKFVANARLADFHHPRLPDAPIRIDWIGNPDRQFDSDGRPAFRIPVLITALRHTNSATNWGWYADEGTSQAVIWCSVDSLPLLFLNAVWERGKRWLYPYRSGQQTLIFLKADQHVRAGERIRLPDNREAHLPVPSRSYRMATSENWAFAEQTTLLVAEAVREDGRVVSVLVPSIELARFYACPTSLLARSLFSGEWPLLERQEGSSELDLPDGERVIIIGQHLVKGLDFTSAAYQARYKYSTQMRYWVNNAGKYLQVPSFVRTKSPVALATKTPYLFEFAFPFRVPDVQPTVVCDCVELGYPGEADAGVLLVTRLRQCDAPFAPYRVEANPHLNSNTGTVEDAETLIDIGMPQGKPGEGGTKTQAPQDDPNGLGSDVLVQPGAPNRSEDEAWTSDDDRSTWLQQNPVRQSAKDVQRYRYEKTPPTRAMSPADKSSLSPGRGQHSNEVETQILAADAPLPVASTLDTFLDAISYLQGLVDKADAFSAQVVECSTDLGGIVPQRQYRAQGIISFPHLGFEYSRWHYLTAGDKIAQKGHGPHRHVALARLKFVTGEHFMVGEIERRPSDKFCMFACSLDGLDDQIPTFVRALLFEIDLRKQWPEWNIEASEWTIDHARVKGRRLFHTWEGDDKEACAKRILRLKESSDELSRTTA